MQPTFDFTIDLGNILTLLVLGGTSVGVIYRKVTHLFDQVETAVVTITGVKDDLKEIKRQTASLRQDVDLLAHRMTRLETLMDVMVPNTVNEPQVRNVLRESGRQMVRPVPGQEEEES
jgi:FtsZ-binding cell division protein ZapB